MRIVAEAACAEGETIHNMPGGATPDQVYAALLVADQYGQRSCQSGNNLLPNSHLGKLRTQNCLMRYAYQAYAISAIY